MTDKINILIDTDIGDDIDDAFALLLAVKSQKINITGISTVYRNSAQRAQIAARLLKKLQCEGIEVCAGIDNPEKEPLKMYSFEKVENGKIQIPHYMPSMADEEYSQEDVADFIEKRVQRYKDLVILAIGPLTNIASWIKKYPQSAKKIKELVIMGGSTNTSRCEWNFRCDPEAAKIVLDAKIKTTMVPVDVTEKCTLSQNIIDQFSASQDEGVKLVVQMMNKYLSDFNYTRPVCLHDPLTLGAILEDICDFEKYDCSVRVEKDRGSVEMVQSDDGCVQVALKADIDKFLRYMLSCCL
jgi:purine nucleosidase